MAEVLTIAPIIIPLMAAISALLLWNSPHLQRYASIIGAGLHLVTSFSLLLHVRRAGIQAIQVGSWPAPYGISIVADMLTAIMLVLTGVIGLAVAIYSLGNIDAKRESFGYHVLFNVLLMGISGAFLTGDMFNLYVWFEVMLIASFVLMALGGEKAQMEGALKYVTLNLIASAIFLAAVGVLYGFTGTLNFADLSIQLKALDIGLVNTLAMMFLVAFGIKAAIFPLFFWLPAAYHTPPAAISAIFAGLLTKVGVYSLIRVFTLLFIEDRQFTHTIILVLGSLTMLVGVLGAISQFEFRRILSFLLISHIGFMIIGLGFYSSIALAGAVFYMMHHIIVKTNLFMVSGIVNRLKGSFHLKDLGGIYMSRPGIALMFFIPALSLAGIPPFSGFWGKFIIFSEGLRLGQYATVAVGVVMSLLTLYAVIKIWNEAFWKKQLPNVEAETVEVTEGRGWAFYLAPAIALMILTIIVGLLAEPVYQISLVAAEQLLDPTAYIDAVLGGPR